MQSGSGIGRNGKTFRDMRRMAGVHGNHRGRLCASVRRCALLLPLLPLIAIAQTRNLSPRRLPTIHTVHDLFLLSKNEARKGYPVDIVAVVNYSDPAWGTFFIQDRTGPTFIDVHGNNIRYTVGMRVLVKGISGVKNDAPAIIQPRIIVLGRGSLPKPESLSIAELDAGIGESYRVVTEGVLHPCATASERICFHICEGAKRLWLVIPEPESPASESLIGATVRVTGIAAQHVDDQQKRIGTELFVESLNQIKVLQPSPPVGFSSPPTPIGDLRAADADQRFAPMMHLRGTVTWQSPGIFSIEDNSGMIFVATRKTVAVRTGSVVDAVGFLSHGVFGLELADAAVRRAPSQLNAADITPLHLTAAEVLKGALNGRRVHLQARLVSQSESPSEFIYQFDDGGQLFSAVLLRSNAAHDTVQLTPDSVLELTGVALIQTAAHKGARNQAQRASLEGDRSLVILIESPADLMVHGGFGWLTIRRALALAGGILLCVLAPLLWGATLRRTVRKQTAMIRARLESEARLETRFRRLFERNLAAVFTWRPDGLILDCNMAFVRLLGLRSREDLIGSSFWDLEIDPVQREQLRSSLGEEALSNCEASLRRDDGVPVHLLTNITPVQTEDGTVYETTAIDVTLLRQHQAALQRARDLAVHDALNDTLTGLPNRKLLLEKLPPLLARAQSEAATAALLYLDLDGFKLVNDSLGHAIGDALLIEVGARLRAIVRAGDILARLGGDEFMVVMDRLSAKEDAVMLAEHLLEAIAEPFHVKDHILAIGVSIGISYFPDDATDAEQLMQQADSAMYAAKREGRNRVMAYTAEIGSQTHERSTLENLLRGAVARQEIFVHYQPEFDLATQRLIRFEALARWTHPTLGQIPPMKFIPIAEESGMIGALGAAIMEQACAEAVRWQSISAHPIQVAVNASSFQFRRPGFFEEVCAILERTGLRPELLQIEVTESAMLGNVRQASDTINRLRDMGITIAIDDFGTGYSNLSYLPSLSFDVLKIDRSFVTNLDSQPETASMIRTLITLAHNFGMRVIVEGVETSAQLAIIKTLGADGVQGYLMGHPSASPMDHVLDAAAL